MKFKPRVDKKNSMKFMYICQTMSMKSVFFFFFVSFRFLVFVIFCYITLKSIINPVRLIQLEIYFSIFFSLFSRKTKKTDRWIENRIHFIFFGSLFLFLFLFGSKNYSIKKQQTVCYLLFIQKNFNENF